MQGKVVPIGQKRKRGRPSLAKMALVYQDKPAQTQQQTKQPNKKIKICATKY